MVTQDARSQATREALMEAGLELFAARGYAAVSLGELVAQAGVTTGALYHQFESKQGLFEAIYAELVEGVWMQVVRSREQAAQQSLLADCDAYLEACANPAFNHITLDAPAVIGWDQILDEAQTMIEASLAAACARGEIAALPNEFLARMLAASLKEAAAMIAAADDPAKSRAAARMGVRQLIGGLLTSSAGRGIT